YLIEDCFVRFSDAYCVTICLYFKGCEILPSWPSLFFFSRPLYDVDTAPTPGVWLRVARRIRTAGREGYLVVNVLCSLYLPSMSFCSVYRIAVQRRIWMTLVGECCG